MANKVIVFTMMVEITDDSGHPEEWDWHDLMEEQPAVAGFALISSEQRPHACMEDDPLGNTKH